MAVTTEIDEANPDKQAARFEQFNRRQVEQALDRLYELLRMAEGPASRPTRKAVRESLEGLVVVASMEEYKDTSIFQGTGFVMEVDRSELNKHWDYFRLLVPATPNLTWYGCFTGKTENDLPEMMSHDD